MTDITARREILLFLSPDKLLNQSSKLWFTVTALGQMVFVIYIAAFYAGTALEGDFNAWDSRMFNGFMSDDILGNLNILLHIVLAFVITASGPVQFIPAVRNRFRTFHRWNGRIYVFSAVLISIGALYLTWSRDNLGTIVSAIAMTINGLAIIMFAALTVRTAMKRQFKSHNTWALRLFLVASGVWYMRVVYGFYALITDGEMPGTRQMIDGPFDIALAFAITLAPLIGLEAFFRAKDSHNRVAQLVMSSIVLLVTVCTAIGSVMAAQIFWLPSF